MELLLLGLALLLGSAFAAVLLAPAERASYQRDLKRVLAYSSIATECADPLPRAVYEPFFDRWGARFSRLRWVQQGVLHVYLLYILTVVVPGLTWTALRSWTG